MSQANDHQSCRQHQDHLAIMAIKAGYLGGPDRPDPIRLNWTAAEEGERDTISMREEVLYHPEAVKFSPLMSSCFGGSWLLHQFSSPVPVPQTCSPTKVSFFIHKRYGSRDNPTNCFGNAKWNHSHPMRCTYD